KKESVANTLFYISTAFFIPNILIVIEHPISIISKYPTVSNPTVASLITYPNITKTNAMYIIAVAFTKNSCFENNAYNKTNIPITTPAIVTSVTVNHSIPIILYSFSLYSKGSNLNLPLLLIPFFNLYLLKINPYLTSFSSYIR